MSSYFLGGVVGSALSSVVYVLYGWAGVSVLGILFGLAILAVWLLEKPLRAAPHKL